jgi:hypothetical protein
MIRISISIDKELLMRWDEYLQTVHDNRSHWIQEQVRKTTPPLPPNHLIIEKDKRQVSRTERWRAKFLQVTEPGKTYTLADIMGMIGEIEDFAPHHNTVLNCLHDFERDGIIILPHGLKGRQTVIGRV